MTPNRNIVGWFELPVSDMERAIKFYETVFDFKLQREKMGPLDMAWFPFTEDPNSPGAGGSLVKHEDFYKPSADGALIYFSSPSEDLENELSRVEKAGGKILNPKTEITPEIGFMAVILDTEGNKVALHSRK
jgi:uncharacterized protein